MRLKRLEAYGFKSFAEKIDVEFDNGITAVVGPNGSGKSNITDAIRWILGEQNVRNLRGTKAEDVIFKGSSTRRALGIAEASLTFVNEGDLPVPFDEVVITRRLFRSGESEFFINKGRCRLKDIHLLLADTGLGRDGVSVISQNHIDNILNSRPEERRLFFEETAGITKYKSKKNEAAHKLEETQLNLVRVGDILSELTSRLGPLSEQAEKAKAYQELQRSLFAYRITELCRRHDKTAADLALQTQFAEKQSDIAVAAEARVHSLEAETEHCAIALLQVDERLQANEKVRIERRQDLEETGKEKAVIEERQRQGELQKQQLEELVEQLAKEISVARQERQSITEQERECRQQLEIVSAALTVKKNEVFQHAVKLHVLEQDYSVGQDELTSLNNSVAEKKEEAILLEQENSFAQSKQDETLEQIGLLKIDAANKQSALDICQKDIDNYLATQNEIKKVLEAAKSKKDANVKQYNLYLKELDRLKGSNHQQKARLEVLLRLQASYEGFGNAVKAVLKSKETWREGIHGVAAELLHTKPEYTKALSVALGGSQEHIVTSSEDVAKQAISFLKNCKAGRATFLPIPSLRTNISQRSLSESGVIGYFNKLVGINEKFAKLADYLLGRTVLVDKLDNALALAKKYNYSLRIVTLDGELLSPGGSLSGGYLRQNENSFLNRQKEIELLQQTIEKESLAMEMEQKKLDNLVEENKNIDSQIAEKLQEQANLNLKMAELSINASQLQQQISELSSSIKELEERMQSTGESYAAMQRRAVMARRSWHELEKQRDLKIKQLNDWEAQTRLARQQAEELAKQVNDAELECTVLQQNMLRFKEIVLLHEKELKRLEQRRLDAQETIADTLTSRENDKAILAALVKTIEEIEADLNDYTLQYNELYQEKMQLLTKQQDLQQSQREAANSFKTAQDELHKLELQQSRLQFALEQCKKELKEDLEVEYCQAKDMCLDLSEEELALNTATVKRKISSLGTVNLQAIEEYEETKTRHEFLTAQSMDLMNAKNNLEKLIKDMEGVMIAQFKDAFAKIRGYFHETFQVLFGGGNADVYLTEENDILHSGVNITVQIPEKKTQNLIALSGGERSLTVVALLLAFLRFKPAPFSVLDEIDAALDEANIVRFASYVKEFSRKTQFIIVTHRKGTMMTADVMYGVTMEVPGVSKIISVKMQSAE